MAGLQGHRNPILGSRRTSFVVGALALLAGVAGITAVLVSLWLATSRWG